MTTSRRGFLGGFAAALTGFSILPAATTYTRLWKAVKVPHVYRYKINPEYENAPYEVAFIYHTTGIDGFLFPREFEGKLRGPAWMRGGEINNDIYYKKVPFPCRFAEIPPGDTMDRDAFNAWAREHSIEPFVKA